MAPTPNSDVSISTVNGHDGSGCFSTGAVVKICLRCENASLVPLVSLLNAHQDISTAQIKLCEYCGLPQLLQSWWHQRQRVGILNSDLVETLVINTGSETTSLLFNKEESVRIW